MTADRPADLVEKRRRLALRALVDEMLAQIRQTSESDDWSDADRLRAEADLERIMTQVRTEAMRKG